MNSYVNFFFGTPKRALITVCCVIAIIMAFNLDDVSQWLQQLTWIIEKQVLPLAIIIAVIFWMLRGITKKGPAKK